jgi:hypothetical protein
MLRSCSMRSSVHDMFQFLIIPRKRRPAIRVTDPFGDRFQSLPSLR